MTSENGIMWARKPTQYDLAPYRLMFSGIGHWSRQFEYPWAASVGDLRQGLWVLDAAGGDGQMQTYLADNGTHVINADLDPNRFQKNRDRRIFRHKADVENLNFLDNSFDRIFCLSVLEHLQSPEKALGELYRVLDVGGRLVVTLDVASYPRWNHTIDKTRAGELVKKMGLTLPEEPDDILEQTFPEINPTPGEPEEVKLKVICFFVTKR